MRLIGKMLLFTVVVLVVAQSAVANSLHVKVQKKLSARENVRLSFKAAPLPEGGYYYAVIVLKAPYKHYEFYDQPPCSVSSNMQRTDYGYSENNSVSLALTPTESISGHWCHGGTYEGGIYAVPHAPPCESSYPWRAEPYKEPCAGVRPGCVEGVVARPKVWHWPDPLPQPLAQGTKIIDHFTIKFPTHP